MASKAKTKRHAAKAVAVERCELCGARLPQASTTRIGHLRASHPRYALGLLLRLTTPLVFLLGVGALGLAGVAQQWAYLLVLALCAGILLAGIGVSRSERAHAGLRRSPPLGQLLRDGGFRFLLIPAVLLLLLLLSRN
jgi:hypothetical protein